MAETNKSVDASKLVPKKRIVRKGPPPKITKKVAPKPPPEGEEFANRNRAFAFSIAQQMKERRRELDQAVTQQETEEIRLSKRPTTRAKGQQTQRFPDQDLESFKKMLLQLRDTIATRSGALKTVALEQTDDRGGEDDDGSDAFARLQSLGQVDQQNKTVAKIDEALRRIEDGTYGVCEVCGQLIRKPRLLNMPFAHTCMECQNAIEKPFGSR